MFKALKHLSKVLKHLSKARKHMFKALKHKFHLRVRKNTPNTKKKSIEA